MDDLTIPTRPPGRFGRLGDTEFICLLAATSAMAAMAIDTILPAFADMRQAFGLPTTRPSCR